MNSIFFFFSKQPLNKLLIWLLDIVAHTTLEVKLHGLKRLHSELSVQQSEVTKLILSSDNVNSVIIEVKILCRIIYDRHFNLSNIYLVSLVIRSFN